MKTLLTRSVLPNGQAREVSIAIDGGAYQPESIVTNGTERHLQQLLLQIEKDRDERIVWRYYFYNIKNQKLNIKNRNHVKLKILILPKIGYGSFWLPLFCLIHRVNIFLGYSTHIPFLLSKFRIRTISAIHDFGFIDFPNKYDSVKRLHALFKNALKRSDEFICFSGFIKKRLRIMTRKPIHLVYPGKEHLNNFKNQKSKIKNKYILHVGRLTGSKNIEEILKLYNDIKHKKDIELVLLGINDEYRRVLEKSAFFMKNKNSIYFVQNISDEQLSNYYRNAQFIINTSLTEGLCFPILEALSLGKKVFVQDRKLYDEYKDSFSNIHLISSIPDMINVKIKKISQDSIINYSWINYFKTIKNICLI